MESTTILDDSKSIKIINILIADDHPLVRRALKNLIEKNTDMKVIAEATNGEEAVKLAKSLHPDIILMDIGMPVMNGLEATRQIKTQRYDIPILVLTVHSDMEHIIGILKAGAAGYLTKVAVDNDIIRAIHAIVAGEAVLSPFVLQQIVSSVAIQPETTVCSILFNNLTEREILILKLAAKGLSNKKIAIELCLSEFTIKSYLGDIFSKINVSSRTEAVIAGLKAGIINFSDLE